MTLLDGVLNLLVAVGYFHFVAFLLLDVSTHKSKRTAPLTYMLLAVFLTCGAHHAMHGYDLSRDMQKGHPLEVLVLIVQLFFVSVWVWLRYESLFGGDGDRSVSSPGVFRAAWLGAYYPGIATGAVVIASRHGNPHFVPEVLLNVLIFLGYSAIALTILRGQIVRHQVVGYWSLSSLAMSAYFMNCALSHLVFAALIVSRQDHTDSMMFLIDALTVVPALAFPLVANAQKPPPSDMRATEAAPVR